MVRVQKTQKWYFVSHLESWVELHLQKRNLIWEGRKLAGQPVGCHGLHSRGDLGCEKQWPTIADREDFWTGDSLNGTHKSLSPEFDLVQLCKAHLNSGGLFFFGCLYPTEAILRVSPRNRGQLRTLHETVLENDFCIFLILVSHHFDSQSCCEIKNIQMKQRWPYEFPCENVCKCTHTKRTPMYLFLSALACFGSKGLNTDWLTVYFSKLTTRKQV